MVDAAQRMQSGQRAIYLNKAGLNLFNAELDPNHTGMIGEEYTGTTTTVGALRAKRTAANPDFAAYIVKLFVENDIDNKDSVLVTMTGSFPGLNLAVLCALETLGIPSLRICSLGASSYGANQPEMTWIDMEDILVREGVLARRSDYATLGGTGDVGGGISDEAQKTLRAKCIRLGYPLLESESTQQQLEIRRELLGNPRGFSLLINIGGNQLMLGGGGNELPAGWIDPKTFEHDAIKTPAIVFDFLNANVPVLNLLHIESIAETAGIPYDPRPLPAVGTSAVFFDGSNR
jgi:poly-gamma-glutamate system protein